MLTRYIKLEGDVVKQKQNDPQEGFIEIEIEYDDDVVCDMIKVGENFVIPTFVPTWDDVNNLQDALFDNKKMQKRIMRYNTQNQLTGKTPKESAAKYQELLQYCQDVRDCDAPTYATPQLAINALNALTVPVE